MGYFKTQFPMRMLTSGWRDRDHWRRSRPSSSSGKPNYKIWHIVQIISSPLNLHSRPSSVLLYSLHDHKVWGGRIFCLMYTCRELIPGSVTSVFDHRYDYYCGPGHIHSSGSDSQTSQYWVFSIHTSHPDNLCHQGQCSRDEYDQIYSPQLQCFLCSWWLVVKPIQA